MGNGNLFNYQLGQKLRDEGISKASSWPYAEPVAIARGIALMLAKKNGEVTADCVYRHMETAPNQEVVGPALEALKANPNSWGSIFRTDKLKFSGRIKNSEKVSRHASVQRIWLPA